MNYVLLFIGATIFLSFKLQAAIKKDDFKWIIFIEKNGIAAFINILVGVAMILAGVDIPLIWEGINFGLFLWVIIGFSGQFIFRKIIKYFETKLNNEKK